MRLNLLRASAALACLLYLVSLAGAQQNATGSLPYRNPALPAAERAADLVGRMTLEEKAAEMINTAPAIPRLGVPAYDYWSEGLHGIARSGYATLFPQAIGNAATFDEPLLHSIGETVSVEARAKYNDAVAHGIHSIYFGLTIWSPNINIFRDPRWGRGQETYGEDPFLTATLGTAFVRGIQGDDPKYFRAIATPKHFAVHSGPESTRHKANVDPSPHDLWDTYLPAFRKTIVGGKADSIMCAYNSIDGEPACASHLLVQDTLRRDWKFGGFVTSDCGAVDDFWSKDGHHFSKSREQAAAEAVRLGTDTNCGDTYLALPLAVRKGLVTEGEIDTNLRRLFEARIRLGLFDPPAQVPFSRMTMAEVLSPAHRALALRAARESMVLLKNDHATLPLAPGTAAKPKTLAVIGPAADDLYTIVGNYYTIPKDPVLAVDGFKSIAGVKVLYAPGAPYADGVKQAVPRTVLSHAIGSGTAEGLKAEYFSNSSFSGKPVLTRTDKEVSFDWTAAKPAEAVPANKFSARWSGTLTAPAPGDYKFSARFIDCYPCGDDETLRITVDGKEQTVLTKRVADSSYPTHATDSFTLHFDAKVPTHTVLLEYSHESPLFGAGLAFEWAPTAAQLREQALKTAANADAVLAFVGLNPNLEGEEMSVHVPGFAGGDRTDIALPAAQQQLLDALKSTSKPLVVVAMNGSALGLDWAAKNADAILEAWYPGQGGAEAIAETIFGRNNPAGRLPVTFYRSVDDLPAFTDYSMKNRTYRYFRGEPVFGFGYGLSYTSFAYSGVKLAAATLAAGSPLHVEAEVRNTGRVAGDEVAELYLVPPQDGVNARHVLAGFRRVHLQPGQATRVSFDLDARALSTVDAAGVRAVRPGAYRVVVAGAQPQPGAAGAEFTITGTSELPH